MAKITTNINVRGLDLKEMLASAKDQLSELGDATWTVTDVSLYAIDDVASKEGMARLWNASVTLETSMDI